MRSPIPVTLNGRYLTLVPWDRSKHLESLYQALGGDEGINQLLNYFPNDTYTAAEELGDWLDKVNTTANFTTLVALGNQTREVAGMASFMRPDAANGVVEVGCVAHGAAMARSPLSTELHYLMARHVFQDLGYRRYEWKCHSENGPSKAAALRYGFTFEGVFRQHMISRGKNRDTAWFSMIDKEWSAIERAFEVWLNPSNFDDGGKQRKRLEDIRAEAFAKNPA